MASFAFALAPGPHAKLGRSGFGAKLGWLRLLVTWCFAVAVV